MSLETPDQIRSLQRKLYCQAKAEPAFRFYLLYDKICREDILRHAYELSRANAGAPGVDGVTFDQIDASGVEAWLAGLREDLVSKRHRPDPVRRAMIPKPGGGDGDGKRRMSGGKSSKRGTPQGGVASPLLGNIYMNQFLKHWRLSRRGETFRAHVVNYADDFVILSCGYATEALAWTNAAMTKLGLMLNEAKTLVKNARKASFDFLGYTFGPQRYRKDGHWYLGASPSKKSVQRIKTKIGDMLKPSNKGAWSRVRDRLNRLLVGWSAYFGYGTRLQAYRAVDNHVYDRFDTSSSAGTKCKDAALADSPGRSSTENWACCSSNARTLGRRREPCDEASRKAGCGPARPV